MQSIPRLHPRSSLPMLSHSVFSFSVLSVPLCFKKRYREFASGFALGFGRLGFLRRGWHKVCCGCGCAC